MYLESLELMNDGYCWYLYVLHVGYTTSDPIASLKHLSQSGPPVSLPFPRRLHHFFEPRNSLLLKNVQIWSFMKIYNRNMI